MKAGLWFLSLGFLAVILWVGLRQSGDSSSGALSTAGTEAHRAADSPDGGSPALPTSLNHVPTPTPLAEIPTVLKMREEVDEDPHSVPGTFLKFVEEISRQKHAVRADPSLKPKFVERLEGVALESDYLPTRAFALRILRELSTSDPSLRPRLEALESQLPPQIIRLSKK